MLIHMRWRRVIVALMALALPSIAGAAQAKTVVAKPQPVKPPAKPLQNETSAARSTAFLHAVADALSRGHKQEASEFEPPGRPPGRPPDPPGHNDPPNPPGKPPDRPPDNSNGTPPGHTDGH